MSHFKGKKLEVSVQVVVSVMFFGFFFFPPEILSFVSGCGSGNVQMVVVCRIITLWAEGSV